MSGLEGQFHAESHEHGSGDAVDPDLGVKQVCSGTGKLTLPAPQIIAPVLMPGAVAKAKSPFKDRCGKAQRSERSCCDDRWNPPSAQ
jgi:hypothetical protein